MDKASVKMDNIGRSMMLTSVWAAAVFGATGKRQTEIPTKKLLHEHKKHKTL